MSGRFGRLEEGNQLSPEPLWRVARGLGHPETKRELDDAEVVPRPSDVARDRNQIGQAEVLPVVRRAAKPQPSRAAVDSNPYRLTAFPDQLRHRGHTGPEH